MTTRDALIRAGIIEPTDTVAQAEAKILGFRAGVLNKAADEMDAHCEQYGVFGVGDRLRRMATAGKAGKDTRGTVQAPAGESTQGAPVDRCPAAHPEDSSPCEGDQDAVTVVDREGTEALGCVLHAARLYASLDRPRVRPNAGHDGAALDVYRRAQKIGPFGWLRGRS